MELVNAISLASARAGGRPAAFVCGHPPRVLVAASWNARLNAQALALWPACRPGEVVETEGLTAFPAQDHNGTGAVAGLLVVAGAHLQAAQRQDLLALARIMEHMDASRLADLTRRLNGEDTSARRDLVRVLRDHNFNIARAARSLGISRETLYKHLKRLHIAIERVPAAVRDHAQEEEEEP